MNGMKRVIGISLGLCIGLVGNTFAQSGQSPTMQQSTSTTDNRQAHPPRPKMKKVTKGEQQQLETGVDSTLPKNRKQRQLRPDSLRRGGATRVDTIR